MTKSDFFFFFCDNHLRKILRGHHRSRVLQEPIQIRRFTKRIRNRFTFIALRCSLLRTTQLLQPQPLALLPHSLFLLLFLLLPPQQLLLPHVRRIVKPVLPAPSAADRNRSRTGHYRNRKEN